MAFSGKVSADELSEGRYTLADDDLGEVGVSEQESRPWTAEERAAAEVAFDKRWKYRSQHTVILPEDLEEGSCSRGTRKP